MLGTTFAAVIAASLLACLVTTIGIYVISRYERWAREHSTYLMCFAAGVLISVSFMHIIPKSFQMNDAVPIKIGFYPGSCLRRCLSLAGIEEMRT